MSIPCFRFSMTVIVMLLMNAATIDSMHHTNEDALFARALYQDCVDGNKDYLGITLSTVPILHPIYIHL